jgi:hypothetical protein
MGQGHLLRAREQSMKLQQAHSKNPAGTTLGARLEALPAIAAAYAGSKNDHAIPIAFRVGNHAFVPRYATGLLNIPRHDAGRHGIFNGLWLTTFHINCILMIGIGTTSVLILLTAGGRGFNTYVVGVIIWLFPHISILAYRIAVFIARAVIGLVAGIRSGASKDTYGKAEKQQTIGIGPIRHGTPPS